MNTHRKIGVVAAFVTAAGAATVLAASPAFAAAVLAPTLGLGGTGAHHVAGNCTVSAGVATNLNQVTYAGTATASSFSTNGSVPIATSVECYVYNTANGAAIASFAGGEPGPEAVAPGTVTVSTNVSAALCVQANALFNDNGTASFDNCPF